MRREFVLFRQRAEDEKYRRGIELLREPRRHSA